MYFFSTDLLEVLKVPHTYINLAFEATKPLQHQ